MDIDGIFPDITDGYRGFHSHGGTPNSWMVFVRDKSHLKWMITRGTPILGNLQIAIISTNKTPLMVDV